MASSGQLVKPVAVREPNRYRGSWRRGLGRLHVESLLNYRDGPPRLYQESQVGVQSAWPVEWLVRYAEFSLHYNDAS
jgi:hypothetical protein